MGTGGGKGFDLNHSSGDGRRKVSACSS